MIKLYRARVEYRLDPEGLGRVKVRVPGLHGWNSQTSIDGLPWAFTLSKGGGQDSGDFLIPEVGSWVMVDKDDYEEQYYILGVIRGVGSESVRGSFIPENHPRYAEQIEGMRETKKEEQEVPLDTVGKDKDPRVEVIHKTIKGATIKTSDFDGNESIDIIGHDGSTLRIATPGIKEKRKLKDFSSPLKVGTTAMFMKDSSGNMVRIMGDSTLGSIAELVTSSGAGVQAVDGSKLLMTIGGSSILIESGKITLSNGSSSITLEGGTINLDAPNINLNSSNCKISGSKVELAGSSIKVGAPNVEVGGGSVSIGPSTELGSPVSAGSPTSPNVKSPTSWSNGEDKLFGGN